MRPPTWAFNGCGFLGGYYLGVWERLSRRCVPRALFDASTTKLVGASAGSLVTAAIASGCTVEATTAAFESIATTVRTIGIHRCSVLELVRCEAEKLLAEDAHERCSDRAAVIITDASSLPTLREERLERFATRQELIDAVLVSSYIPGLMARPRVTSPHLLGRRVFDGGIWPLECARSARTVSVSPFGGSFDISPSSHRGRRWLPWPRGWLDLSPANAYAGFRSAHPAHDLDALYRAGFEDCERFLRSELPGTAIVQFGMGRRPR
mmetsp:Transcript_62653/g.186411  ORF Transcript_62653/g.186411 Transcript_62653/m.186411 type:complete len:266 (+) Transcript_62653:102-899(+)